LHGPTVDDALRYDEIFAEIATRPRRHVGRHPAREVGCAQPIAGLTILAC
jgi:hypothetical protein